MKILISLLGILLISSFAFAELELPKQPDNLRIVAYHIYFNDDGMLDRVEIVGNFLKKDEIVGSGEKDITEKLNQAWIDKFTEFKDLAEDWSKTRLKLK